MENICKLTAFPRHITIFFKKKFRSAFLVNELLEITLWQKILRMLSSKIHANPKLLKHKIESATGIGDIERHFYYKTKCKERFAKK